jgi:hypothetical protein
MDVGTSVTVGSAIQPLLCFIPFADHQCTLAYGARGSDTNQCLASSTRQHHHSRSATTIAEHLGQCSFLIGPDIGGWLQVDFEIGIEGVAIVAKVVLLQWWQVEFNALAFDILLEQASNQISQISRQDAC